MKQVQPIIDRFLNMAISKKLTVFFVATIFLGLGKLESEQWENVAMVYLCSQGVIDVFVQILKARKNSNTISNEYTGPN